MLASQGTVVSNQVPCRTSITGDSEPSPDMASGEDPMPSSQTEKENKSQTLLPLRSSQAQQVCRFYSQGRFCQYGKRCRFLHECGEVKQALKGVDNRTDRAAEFAEHTDSHTCTEERSASEVCAYAGRPQPSGPGAPPVRRERTKRSCRYFLSGYCAMEDRCRFWHPEQLSSVDDQPGSMGKGGPGPRVPAARPSTVQESVKLSELTADVVKRLRDTEISQLLKRIPKDQLVVQEREDGQLTYYRIIVQPTDPDWPFDLKEIDIMISFPETYPQEVFTVDVPADQDLPAVMGRHLCQASQEWLQAKWATNELMGKAELLFRPFLRWLDRNMERLFTEGARQLKKDIEAERSGIRFVPYQQLQAAVCREQGLEPESAENLSDPGSSGASDKEEWEEEEENDDDGDGDGDEENEKVAHGVEGEESSRAVENVKSSEPRRGTEMRLQGLELGDETATVVAKQITVTLQCNRCKVTADLTLTGRLKCTAQCEKCSSSISAEFRPSMLHHFSSVLGFLDLNGAVPVDLVLQDCELLVGCLTCSQEGPLQKLSYGQSKEVNCQHCHTKLRILAESTHFQHIQPRSRTQAGRGDTAYRLGRYPRDLGVQRGKPLPENGTCKHFRQSQRWLRFPCCGRAFPCDACHDEEQDHPMELATRMICGHCAKEQAYSNAKPCISCGGMMTRATHTSHWEGGQGCRNKVKMNRNDRQKYSNTNKTVSRKATGEK